MWMLLDPLCRIVTKVAPFSSPLETPIVFFVRFRSSPCYGAERFCAFVDFFFSRRLMIFFSFETEASVLVFCLRRFFSASVFCDVSAFRCPHPIRLRLRLQFSSITSLFFRIHFFFSLSREISPRPLIDALAAAPSVDAFFAFSFVRPFPISPLAPRPAPCGTSDLSSFLLTQKSALSASRPSCREVAIAFVYAFGSFFRERCPVLLWPLL